MTMRTLMVAAVLVVFPTLGWAQAGKPVPTLKREAAKPISPTDGAQMYASYCSACHGRSGHGDGPAAPALKTKPTDLTQLKKTHGGTYATKEFQDKVTGTSMSVSHGSTDMPIWGPIFRGVGGNEELRIFNLKQYIDAMQMP
jgi:mono/diheme cytochrome c family protein